MGTRPGEDAVALDGVLLVPVVRSGRPSAQTSARLPPNFFRERFRPQRYHCRETTREDTVSLDSSASEQRDNASDFPIAFVPVNKKWRNSFNLSALFLFL